MASYTYGYARVSTRQQELNRQLDLLKQYNCDEILTEKLSVSAKYSTPSTNSMDMRQS